MAKKIDLTGQRFGKLVVINKADKTNSAGHLFWNCICDCGNSHIVSGAILRSGKSKSCGCDRVNDLTGKRFGKLKVIERAENTEKGGTTWLCKCDCGNEKVIRGSSLISGSTISCGCYNKEKNKKLIKDLTGKRFGKLTVIEKVDSKIKGIARWKCKCDCGNIVEVNGKDLRYKNGTRSCGCLQKEAAQNNYIDITGEKYGRLTVVKKVGVKNGSVLWLCKCDCGNYTEVTSNALRAHGTQSCGCLKKESDKEAIQVLHSELVEDTNLKMIRNIDTVRVDSETKHRGVHFAKWANMYRAYIQVNKKMIYLGYYKKIEDAIKARKIAEEKYFHPILEKYGKLESKEEPCSY